MITTSEHTSTTPTETAARLWVVPRASLCETPEAYVIEAEMPGVGKDRVEVRYEEGQITLLGNRVKANETSWLHRESSGASYRRAFTVDARVDPARIDARMEQGVLRVSLPKVAAAKPRQIPVNG